MNCKQSRGSIIYRCCKKIIILQMKLFMVEICSIPQFNHSRHSAGASDWEDFVFKGIYHYYFFEFSWLWFLHTIHVLSWKMGVSSVFLATTLYLSLLPLLVRAGCSTGGANGGPRCCEGKDITCVTSGYRVNSPYYQPCYCDTACKHTRDCCADYAQTCQGQYYYLPIDNLNPSWNYEWSFRSVK